MKRPLKVIDEPLWKGPQVDGITFSQLCRFLGCRDRFHMKMVQGYEEEREWNHKIEYGSMWHQGEEENARHGDWKFAIIKYRDELRQKYPGHEQAIMDWASICLKQFPIYIDYYRNHPTQRGRKPLLQEEEFRIKYELPDGHFVILRGKIDEIFRWIKRENWIQENKTKGEIDQPAIPRVLSANLQTGIYIVAGERLIKEPISGVIYNVVRRPLSDRYAIRKRKKESTRAFHLRLAEVIKAKRSYYFIRSAVRITPSQQKQFRREILDPILMQLCDWWDSIQDDPFNPWKTQGRPNRHHYRMPFGLFNALASGFRGDYFDYYTLGTRRGLVRVENLYPELGLTV